MKIFKKWLVLLFSVVLLSATAIGIAGCNPSTGNPNSNSGEIASSENPAVPEADSLAFTLSDDGTHYIVSGIGSYPDTNLVIPDTYKTLPVQAIGDKAFYEELTLTSITIPSTILSIGERAFEGCAGCVELTLHDGVTSIGNKAFARCINVKIALLPTSVEIMGNAVFNECPELYVLTNWTEQPEGWADDWFIVDSEGNGAYYDGSHWESVENGLFIYEDWFPIQNATCDQDGEERRNCLNVDGHYQTRPIPAKHDTEFFEGQDASCTQNGWSDYEACKNCEYSTYTVLQAKGHDYENGVCSVCQQGYSDGLIYTLSNDKTYYIVSASSAFTDDELSIAPTYNDLPVKEIKNDAFKNNKTITYATIPDSITAIGTYAFYGCSALTGMSISNSLTTIGAYAFYNCSALTSLTIPEQVTSIGNSAFHSCKALTLLHYNAINLTAPASTYNNLIFACAGMNSNGITLTIGKNVKQIPAYLFNANMVTPASIVTLDFEEDSVCEKIGDHAFAGVKTLKNIYFPDTKLTIESDAFSSCTGLETLVFPDSVTSIGAYAFGYCSALKSLTFGKGLTSLEDAAFDSCTALTEIYYNATQCSDLKFGNYVFSYVGQNSDGISLTIGKDVQKLPSYLFSPYSSAEKFAPNVTRLVFEKDFAPERIGSYVFDDCVNVEEIYYDGAITLDCTNLLTQNVGKNVERLTGIIGKNAKTIPANFFAFIDVVIFEDGSICESIGDFAFSGSNITEILLPNSIKSIGKSAFQHCKQLKTITIPDSVTSLGESAFTWCESLESAVLGNGLTTIERATFYGCSKLTDFTFGSSIRSIGFSAFYNASSLTNVYYTGNTADWCTIAFSAAESTPLYYADNLYIDGMLITKLVLPDSVTEIKDYAFYHYQALTEIVIPVSLTAVGGSAFDSCNIDCVYYQGTEEDWLSISFSANTSEIQNATRYYFSENEPTEAGKYWHYNSNGEIVLWFPEE